MDRNSFVADVRAELRRIGLDPDALQGLAVRGDSAHLLTRLRALDLPKAVAEWTVEFEQVGDSMPVSGHP